MKLTKIYILLTIVIGITACEDPIDVALDQAETLIVVDGFINDLPTDQIIKISSSQAYF